MGKGRLTIVHGDKGGIGKSFVCAVYLDALLSQGGKEQIVVVESDTRNPDIARIFHPHFQLENIDLRLHDGWMGLADLLAENRAREIVISMPAGIGHAIEVEGDYLASVLADLGHDLRVLWPINRLKDSVILLKEFLGTPLADRADEITVVLNGFFGPAEKFLRWNESKTRREFLARKGTREAYLPELHERVVDAVAAPFSLAEGLKYSERAEMQRWLREAQAAVCGEQHV